MSFQMCCPKSLRLSSPIALFEQRGRELELSERIEGKRGDEVRTLRLR